MYIYFVFHIALCSFLFTFAEIKLNSIMEFRNRIKEICNQKGLTQKELAEKLGITDISLNKTLRGEYPQLQTLEKIANVLEVSIVELFSQPATDVINCPYCGNKIKVTKE